MGENLFYSSAPMSWTDVITAWHNEVALFKYPKGDWKATGHYTQVTLACCSGTNVLTKKTVLSLRKNKECCNSNDNKK